MALVPYDKFIGTPGVRINVNGVRSNPRTKDPLSYRHTLHRGWYSDSVTGDLRTPTTHLDSPSLAIVEGSIPYSTSDAAYVKAYDALVSTMTRGESRASMGVTVGETSSSLEMIHSRLGTLNKVRELLFSSDRVRAASRAASLLKLRGRKARKLQRLWPTAKSVANDLASAYLEIIFGWMPLVKDIQSAIKTLSNPPKTSSVSGKGVDDSIATASQTPPWLPPQGWLREKVTTRISRRVQCVVSIANPNLDLANRVGFVNWPQTAWQLLPGSFLVDWFIPVGRFLESYTDFVGRSISHCFMTVKTNSQWVRDSNYAGVASRGLELTEDISTSFHRVILGTLTTPNRFRSFRLPVQGLLGRATSLCALFVQSFIKR